MASPLLLDMAIHTLDTARYLSNADPVAVYCDEFNPPWSWYKGNASAVAIFEMTGGLRYIYRGSWCAEGLATSWEAEWRAVGPGGAAIWDGTSDAVAEVVTERGEEFVRTEHRSVEPKDSIRLGIVGALHDFVHALRTGETPMGECHDNIKSLAMVFRAIASATSGRRIAVEV
jgi:predicted dehydrogenase